MSKKLTIVLQDVDYQAILRLSAATKIPVATLCAEFIAGRAASTIALADRVLAGEFPNIDSLVKAFQEAGMKAVVSNQVVRS